jgi:malto-oligosyltrehalose trehalohydrolase
MIGAYALDVNDSVAMTVEFGNGALGVVHMPPGNVDIDRNQRQRRLLKAQSPARTGDKGLNKFAFGPVVAEDGVTFRIWAPRQRSVSLRLDGRPDALMEAQADGWFTLLQLDAGPGTRYSFVTADGTVVPDPGSRYQPDDVHGPSEVVDEGFAWKQSGWRGRPWAEMVIYELHVGTFTPQGTFLTAIERLDHLGDLGVTAIQLMPVNQFRGDRGWGYDGVLPYGPDNSYGRPEDLKTLIDAAHARNICVFLDVVYNHFGPDGNYMPSYAPLFTERHSTPWGDGINYDDDGSPEVRKFIVENVVYWIEQFRIDGLRFDAVHAIKDDSEEHLLQVIARRARQAAGDRHLHLIVENEDNHSDLLERDADGKPQLFTAQWNDDIHHVLHAAATGEDFGYYADYAHDAGKLVRGLGEGFVYQGEEMPYRGSPRGQPSSHLPPVAFVSFIQNHDQVGNRAFGDRLPDVASALANRAVAGIYLLAPQIPMMFMGEEWGARTPFPYFCDFDDDLNDLVRKGRRKELSRLPGFDEDSAASTPDPTDIETFRSAKLDWDELGRDEHCRMLALYRELIAVRRRDIIPFLADCKTVSSSSTGGVATVVWALGADRRLQLVANLSEQPRSFGEENKGRTIWSTGHATGSVIAPWTVVWSIS